MAALREWEKDSNQGKAKATPDPLRNFLRSSCEISKNNLMLLFMIKFAEKGYFLQSERQDQRDHPQFFLIHWQSG